ncbi:hypothetical protein BpHYR1_038866 [Brachionus plicatilis]|uniref:Uncharacterized protein n=1 Tax=Brachionus plicatilis TaxID=10195 RepID=A0A3M7RQL5_BRAPC|nr:hypothetical protein BpHYR1_038866 [Brachionus plicatilis]
MYSGFNSNQPSKIQSTRLFIFSDLNAYYDKYYFVNHTWLVKSLSLKSESELFKSHKSHSSPSPDFKILNTEEEIYAKIATKF